MLAEFLHVPAPAKWAENYDIETGTATVPNGNEKLTIERNKSLSEGNWSLSVTLWDEGVERNFPLAHTLNSSQARSSLQSVSDRNQEFEIRPENNAMTLSA